MNGCFPGDGLGVTIPEGYQAKLRCPRRKGGRVEKIMWVTPAGKVINEKSFDARCDFQTQESFVHCPRNKTKTR